MARDPDDHCSRRHPTQNPPRKLMYFVRLNRRRNRPGYRAWRSSEGKRQLSRDPFYVWTPIGTKAWSKRIKRREEKKEKEKNKKKRKTNYQLQMNLGTTIQNLDPWLHPQFPIPHGCRVTPYSGQGVKRGPDKIPFPAIRRPHPQPPDASKRPQELMWSTPHKSHERKKQKKKWRLVANIRDFEVHTTLFELARFDILRTTQNSKPKPLSTLGKPARRVLGPAIPVGRLSVFNMIFAGYIPWSIYTLVC